jgi:hypothetical protein
MELDGDRDVGCVGEVKLFQDGLHVDNDHPVGVALADIVFCPTLSAKYSSSQRWARRSAFHFEDHEEN